MPKTILNRNYGRWLFSCLLLLSWQVAQAQVFVTLQGTDPLCFGLGSGSVVSSVTGGVGPYTYFWSNGETTPFIENLTAGTYGVTVTDANSVQGTASVTLNEPPQVTLDLTSDQNCEEPFELTANGGGGVPPYTYNWSTGANTPTVSVPAGSYCVTIVDANLCGTFDCIDVMPNPPTVGVTAVNVTCFGGENGSLTAFPAAGTPPYTFAWSNGGTTQTINNLSAGTYTVTITDAGGCTASATGLVNQPPLLTVNVTNDGPVCTGVFDRTATAFPSGGTPGYTYLWSTGATTQAISGLGAGTYSVTVTDQNNCTVVGATTIVQSPSPDVVITGDDVICGAGNSTDLTATPSGGTPGYQLLWSTGSMMPVITVTMAGTYSVTVTDAAGCTDVASYTVSMVNLSVTTSQTNVTCNGFNDGTATVFGSGGTQPYTYLWSTGATTQTITGLAPGNYSFTITEVDNCKASGMVTITQPDPIQLTGIIDNPDCPGDMDGSIDLSVSGGTPAYTYAWSNGAITQDISGLGAGAYSVTVTDQNNCTATTTFTLVEPLAIDLSTVVTDVDCFGEATGAIDLTVSGGTSPYTYDWSDDGQEDPDDDPEDRTGLIAATYQVTVTDANGCMAITQATVNQPPPLSLSTQVTNILCFGQSTGAVDLTVTGGTLPYFYNWSNGFAGQDLSDVTAGTYTVTVTDGNNCQASTTVTITQPNQLTLTGVVDNVDCFGGNDGSIDITVGGGTQPYNFNWSNGAITEDITNLTAGNYSVTVTDANNCGTTATFTITQPNELVLTTNVTDIDCAGEATGAIDLTVGGGTFPYTYDWSNDGPDDPDDDPQDLTNLTAGTYTVTVTDANGCTAVTSATVTAPNALAISTDVTNVLCFGESTGAVDLTVSGGTPNYTYNWSNGSITQDLNNVPAGTYSVTVIDANECQASTTVTVTQPSQLTLTGLVDNVDCFGDNTGAIDITVGGGTQPYTFSWSNGAITEDIFGLVAGSYSVTVTDANNCTVTASFTVTQPNGLALTTTVTDIACAGDATGAIDLTVGGGTFPYTYDWSNDGPDDPDDDPQDLTNLTAGTYTVTVTDANGCTAVTSATVEAVSEIIVSAEVNNADCFGEASGTIDLTVLGGTGPYTYQWSNGAITQDIMNLLAGTYTVTVTDVNECTEVASYIITQPDELLLNISAPTIVCGGTNSGSIISLPTGGTEPYSYLWSNGATTSSINDLPAGIYSLTVTDANGCTAIDNAIQLNEIPELTCSVEVLQEPTMGDNGSVTVNVDGGTQPFTYAWSTGANTQTINDLGAGTYTVTVTDANNCTTVCSATLEAFSGIGDFVWEDFNANGQQDPGEPGLEDYPVYLKDENGNIIDSTLTDADGFYAFLGLVPGTYSILFPEPPGGIRTLANVGDDATDSDGDPAMNGMTQNYTLAPGEFNMTVDAGFFAVPGGGIADPCSCLNNNTTNFDGQFTEAIEITANIGQTWTIIANENMFLLGSPDPPAAPIPVPLGTILTEEPIPGEPTMAKYVFEFLLVDSFQYSVTVSNGAFQLTLENQCFYPEVDFVEAPPQEVCRFDLPILLEGFGVLNGEPLPGNTVITINGDTINVLDPMDLPLGEVIITAEFLPDPDVDDDGLEFCRPRLERTVLIIDDCPAKVGDFVWNDLDFDGIQDPGEPGIEDVMVIITSQDGTYADTTFTDGTGMYMFMVDPGTYKITFEQPEGLTASPQNAGTDDALDSDINGAMLMTDFFTLGPNEMDFTIDAGFYDLCIANVDNPGTIGFDQELCGAGNIPDLIIELTPATGGVGEINYLWMKNTADPSQPISFWTPIPDSNTPNLQLGPVYESTYYARCVRRNNCVFLESNSVFIEVGDDAVAIINGPELVCEGETVTYTPVGADNATNVQWSFTGSPTVVDNGDGSVDVTWPSFGIFQATLSVTENGCTATRNMRVVAINNPATCGDDFTANGQINNLVARELNVNWVLPMDGSLLTFTVERSTDGQNFQAVGLVTEPLELVNGDMGYYQFDDVAPVPGWNYYRVWAEDTLGNAVVSNVVELNFSSGTTQMAQVYPNPATGNMIHVQMLATFPSQDVTTIELYSSTGVLISSQPLPFNSASLDLPLNNQPSGIYLLRVVNGDEVETHQVVVE